MKQAINTTFIKEWTAADFDKAKSDICAHFAQQPITTHREVLPKAKRAYAALDEILGLAYTSSGAYAGYWICNAQISSARNSNFHYQGFAIGENGATYAVLNDDEENELIYQIGEFTDKLQVLNACEVDGLTVKLPPTQLPRELYEDVKKALELIGGKWKGGKVMGFVFPHEPTELLKQLQNGEQRNLKKEFQFFGTPPKLADKIAEMADIKNGDAVLEPSAGQGAIIEAVFRTGTDAVIKAIEIMPTNCQILLQKGYEFKQGDFIAEASKYYGLFDKVVANPPFRNNQDIDHIKKMYLCLKEGGRLVSIASKHWQIGSEAKCVQFKQWLDEVGATVEEVPAGEFKESGTNIATCIIIINK